MDQIFDTIIVGGGASGISAAIYAVRKSLNVLLVTRNIGGQAALSGDVENYLGFTLITGADLAKKFREDLERFNGRGITIKEGVEVKNISGTEGNFIVNTSEGDFKGRTVIVASGRIPRMLGVPGEKELLGKGVATCATCDGPFYRGKDVVIVGGGNSALDSAFSLMKVAKTVSIVNITESLKGDDVLLKSVTSSKNVNVLNNTTVVEIIGQNFVEGVKVQNQQTHSEKTITCQGVFIEIGYIPSVDFIPQVAKDKQNRIIVDEYGITSVPGIWAAGDVNNLWGEQIIIAAGEGAKVALAVAEHISKGQHQSTSNIHEG